MPKQNQFSLGASPSVVDLIEVGKEGVTNHIPWVLEGWNTDVGTAYESIWECGVPQAFPDSAQVLSLVSTDAADTELGTGAQTVFIIGLDANYDPVSETVIMDGLTPVLTTALFIRVNNLYVLSAGTSAKNVGSISVTATTPASVISCIPAGYSVSADTHITVPRGMTLYPLDILWGVGKKQAAVVDLESVISLGGVEYRVKSSTTNTQGTSTFSTSFPLPRGVFETSDLWLEAASDVAGTSVSLSAALILVDSLGRDLTTADIFG